MKRRNLFITLIVTTIVLIAIIALINIIGTSNKSLKTELEQKGFDILGSEHCMSDHSLEGGGDAFTTWECKLCGKIAENPDTNVPTLCENLRVKKIKLVNVET